MLRICPVCAPGVIGYGAPLQHKARMRTPVSASPDPTASKPTFAVGAKRKIAASLAGAALLVALVTMVSFWALRQIERTAETRRQTVAVVSHATDLLSAMKDGETGQRGFSLTGDETFLEPYLAIRDSVAGQVEALRRETPSGAATPHVELIAHLVTGKMAELARIVDLRRGGNVAAVQAAVASGVGKRLMDSIRVETRAFVQIEEGVLAEDEAAFQATMQRLFAIIVGASLTTLLLALVCVLLIERNARHRLKDTVHLEALHLLEVQDQTNARLEQAVATVRNSEARLAVTLNSIGDAVIATDTEGRITLLNPLAAQLTGWVEADAMARPVEEVFQIFNRDSRQAVVVPVKETLADGVTRNLAAHTVLKARDGREYSIADSCAPIRDGNNQVIGAVLVFRDVTALRRAEADREKLDQRLRDQQFYTRSLIESNIDALMTTDPEGIITDVNKQMEALTGSTRDELIGSPFKDSFTNPQHAQAGIEQVLREGKVTNYELTARARDGTLTTVSYNASTFHDRSRALQGVFAAARDVTSLKRIEQALQLKNIELEDASRMKSEFLANMSHELRTPLNAIIGFSEALTDGLVGELTAEQRGFIGDIFGSGKHLLSLINDILDLSKVEAGKMALDLEPVELGSVFANSISIIREKAASRGIRVSMDVATGLDSIQADARKVKQIVYNLLSNAVKFSSDGGAVTLRGARVPRAAVGRLESTRPGRSSILADSDYAEFLEISVTDAGIGISPEGLVQLFKPFSQIDSGLARRFEGTGLGLAMVKQLAELHGGAVAVESATGEGARFTVWLPFRGVAPVLRVPARLPSARSEGVAPELPGVRTALVVEDDVKSAELIRIQLEAEGFTVLHAASAEAALILAVQQPLSLITLDIQLPNMDGWEFLTLLKKASALKHIPVVIISIVADRHKGFALGAAAVMQKPISRQEMYESLVELGLFPLEPGRALKVLVVDDDPKAVDLVAVRLKDLASTVLRAYGGAEAIAIARLESPDLVVLDLMMPGVSGFDVVRALQEQPATARIPILVVTAKQVTAEDRALLSGFVTTILGKGEFDHERFLAEVRRAMSGRLVVA